MKETDLSAPVKTYLNQQGYRVQSEVKDCDITAQRGNDLVIVELKKSVNMTLLIQATARQKLTHRVYVAIPEPTSQKGNHWRGTLAVLSRLNLGLLLVNFNPPGITVKEALSPDNHALKANKNHQASSTASKISGHSLKKRNALLQELEGRTLDLNEAGSHRRQLVTAYRESAVFIATCLQQRGASTTAQLRAIGTGDKTATVLAKNYYGWFERVKRGTYQLTEKGQSNLEQYPELTALSKDHINRLNVKLK